MRISDWSSDVCSSDRARDRRRGTDARRRRRRGRGRRRDMTLTESQQLAYANTQAADARLNLEVEPDDGMVLNMGPQHPVTHGTMRLVARPDGAQVVSADVLDRKRVVSGQSVSVRVDLGGGRFLKKNEKKK